MGADRGSEYVETLEFATRASSGSAEGPWEYESRLAGGGRRGEHPMSPGASTTARRLVAAATLVALMLGFVWAPAARADAEAGDLDTSFGSDGIVATAFTSFGGAFATDVVIQGPRIAAVGGDGGGRFALGVYNSNGSVRQRTTTNFGHTDTAHAAAFQSDGRIVAAGVTEGSGISGDWALARYRAGVFDLDPSFGGEGKVTTDIEDFDQARGVALQPDGRIVVAGQTIDDGGGVCVPWPSCALGSSRFAIARYMPDGSPDSSFHGNGKRTDSGGAVAEAVAIQPDGAIVTAGWAAGDPERIVLMRHLPNGNLDKSFDGDGKLQTAFGSAEARALAVAIQPDGKIVAAGSAGAKVALVRYDADGSLDLGFGDGGRVTTSIGAGNDRAKAVAIQPDGKIVIAGRTDQGAGDVALARYLPTGALDPAFGTAGKVTTGLGGGIGGDESANGIAIQDDGRIVIAGSTSTGDGRFLLARYHAEAIDDTPPDTTISGPSGAISQPEPSFELASTEPGSSFECELDGAGFEPCSSPHAVGPLADGEHTLRARATDEAGRTDPTPDNRSFTVDTTVAIQIKGKRLPLRKRRLVVRLACPGDEASGPCRGSIVVKTRGKVRFEGKLRRVKLAVAPYSIEAGETGRVRARLGKERRRVKRIIRLLGNEPQARRAKTIARVRDGAGNRARVVKKQRIRMR